ncbi:hypothetical protein AUC47_14670 [Microbacterium sp. SZ1]|uniref:HNH endonuclease signature motif containing protein n=1 Tax=Microbacterium sp. SZ1 TaxID=1849736 RepID=UPI000BBB6D6C|nr:HNH endonuclease signature motif containing protein [Microbacterium sp. SZ1]PCE15205.1 hypothetical protein AUC47_14670 [Microbacterium sp. SZ1]
MSSRTLELLDQIASDLDRALGDDALAGLTDEERIAIIAAAGAVMRRVEAVVVEALATGDAVDLPHLAGCRSQNELLQRALAVDASAATRFGRVVDLVRRDVNLLSGERMPARWPALRDALLSGRVGIAGMLAATAPIETAWERLTADERAGADECLAEAARAGASGADIETGAEADEGTDEFSGADGPAGAAGPVPTPDDLAYLAHTIVAVLDPDGAEPDDRNAQHRRGITLGRLRDGLRSIRGWLSPEVAAQLEAVMDAVNNPAGEGSASRVAFFPSERSDGAEADDPDPSGSDPLDSDPFDSDPFDSDPFNSDSRAVIDPRTATQKRHDAFAAALGIAARHRDMPTLGGAAPTLVVTVDARDLDAGSGWASLPGAHGDPQGQVPVRVAAQAGCSGTIQRVTMREGRIVGIDSTDRVFTVHQRRAIVARDKECLIPGCHVPAAWCEIHHVTEHARGGPTTTDNGVPLCWWHHRSLDGSGWEIRMSDGVPQVRGPAWWDREQRWRTPRLSTEPRLARAG